MFVRLVILILIDFILLMNDLWKFLIWNMSVEKISNSYLKWYEVGRRGGGVDNDIFFGCLWEMILSFRGFFLCLEVERGYGGYI